MARRRAAAEDGGDEEEDEASESVERVFEGRVVPGWREQLTVRAFAVSVLLGAMFSVIVMKLNLTTGIIPSLNVSAGLLGFFLLTSWTKLLDKAGVAGVRPFTRQENTVVQTCVVACSGIAFSGNDHHFLRRRVDYHQQLIPLRVIASSEFRSRWMNAIFSKTDCIASSRLGSMHFIVGRT
jgi:hypothetical protein